MDGGTEFLVEEVITLMLVALLAGAGFLWRRASWELGHLRALFDEFPNPILRVDLVSFEPLICNRTFSRLVGYADNQQCVAKFNHHPHLPQQNFYQIYRLAQDPVGNVGAGVRTNIVLRDRQGNIVNQHLVVILDDKNRYMDLVLDHPGSDHANRHTKDQESAVAAGEDVLLQQNLLVYLKLDQKLNIVSCNQVAKTLFKIRPGTATFADLLPAENANRLISIYRRRLTRHGRLLLKHQTRIGADDKPGNWSIYKDPVEDYYHAFFSVDATNTFLDTPVSDLLDKGHGVWQLDHRTGLLQQSENWTKHLGYDASTNTDKFSFWISTITPADRERVTKTIQCAKQDEPFSVQYKLASGTGIELEIETRGFVVELDASGNPAVTRGIHIDVTGAKAKGLDRNSHHELMNQLASILGYADMIQANTQIPVEVKGFAREVLNNGEKIRSLLSPTDQHQVGSVTSIEKIANRHKLVISGDTFLRSSVAESVLEEIIRQVLSFMISESSGESKCRVTVSQFADAQCSVCTQEIRSNTICLTLEQDDLHIERNHFLHLLDPGFITSSLGQESSLISASELVHEHGGHMRLRLSDSRLAIALYLPESNPLEQRPPVPHSSKQHRSDQRSRNVSAEQDIAVGASAGRSILIIDNEISVASYLEKIVQNAGYKVTVFTDSGAALDHFRHDPYKFDLVITDQTMPGYSGDVIMKSMRQQNPQLPIIVCSGHSEADYGAQARNMGAADYVTKPVVESHLLQVIEQSIGRAQ